MQIIRAGIAITRIVRRHTGVSQVYPEAAVGENRVGEDRVAGATANEDAPDTIEGDHVGFSGESAAHGVIGSGTGAGKVNAITRVTQRGDPVGFRADQVALYLRCAPYWNLMLPLVKVPAAE